MALDEKLEAMLEGSFIVKDVQELARRYRKQKEALREAQGVIHSEFCGSHCHKYCREVEEALRENQ